MPVRLLLSSSNLSYRYSNWNEQAYNSIFNAEAPSSLQLIGNFPLLPLRTKVRGPAYTLPLDPSLAPYLSPDPDSESYDVLDEVLSLFRANTFFRNFEIQGPADRLLIYGILWVSECLGKIRPNMSARYVRLHPCFLEWETVSAWVAQNRKGISTPGPMIEPWCWEQVLIRFCVHREAQKEVQNIALDSNFAIPGDPGFPLNQVRHLSHLLFSF